MIEKLEIKLKYRVPSKYYYYPRNWRYFCEVVYDGDRYTVQINEEQYTNDSDHLHSLVTNRLFLGPKLYCLTF